MAAMDRRTFVKSTVGATASFASLRGGKAAPSDRVVVGVMGTGGRGTYLATAFAGRKDAEVAYVCDADVRRADKARAAVTAAQQREPKSVQDFRRILDDRSVDVLVNATPDHWHALGTILACQAGKDVYVEKPLAHNIREGRKMVAAARKFGRVVQVGLQSRSAPYMHEALDYVRSGALGNIRLVRVFNMMQHSPMAPAPDQDPPVQLDWEIWCGPAAKPSYNPRRYWLNFFEYSCGPIPGSPDT